MSKCIGNVRVTKQPFCQETCQSCYVIVWLDRENFTIYGLEKKRKQEFVNNFEQACELYK